MIPVWSDEFLSQSKKLGGFRQTLLFHDFEEFSDRFWRILQTRPLTFGSFANGIRMEINQVKDELVRMLWFDSELVQIRCRKVLQIERHNHISTSPDRSSKDMAVILIWQRQSGYQAFVAGHQAIDILVHVLPGLVAASPDSDQAVP